MEDRIWAITLRAHCTSLERLTALGLYTPKEVLDEVKLMLEHPRGCPDDVKERLEKLRKEASAKLV